jgi:hypothetical protein
MNSRLPLYIVRSGGWWIFYATQHFIYAESSTAAIRHALQHRLILPGTRINVQLIHIQP